LIAQIINDETGMTLVSVHSGESKAKTPRERAEDAAGILAKRAADAGIKEVVFDRGGFTYTGTIAAFAQSARKAGLSF